MYANRPITMSLPLGLFSAATISGSLPKIPKTDSTLFPLNPELLDMPAIASDDDERSDVINWVDETS